MFNTHRKNEEVYVVRVNFMKERVDCNNEVGSIPVATFFSEKEALAFKEANEPSPESQCIPHWLKTKTYIIEESELWLSIEACPRTPDNIWWIKK